MNNMHLYKANIPSLFFFIALVFGIQSCAARFQAEEMRTHGRHVTMSSSASLTDPTMRQVTIDEKGQVLFQSRQAGKDPISKSWKLGKVQRDELWTVLDSAYSMNLKPEYQMANDTRVYQIQLVENGVTVRETRFSTGAPAILKRLIYLLEEIYNEKKV